MNIFPEIGLAEDQFQFQKRIDNCYFLLFCLLNVFLKVIIGVVKIVEGNFLFPLQKRKKEILCFLPPGILCQEKISPLLRH